MCYYKVAEIFESINGEGKKQGQLALFIRFFGCNLDCSYCDTKPCNNPQWEVNSYSVNELREIIHKSGITNVTLTGGEPLMQPNIFTLLKCLSEYENIDVEIETNGSVDVSEIMTVNTRRPSLTMDYKLQSSGMEKHMNLGNLKLVTKHDCVKFVCGDLGDLNRAVEVINEYDLLRKCNVFFSPVFGKIEPSEIVRFMSENKLNGVTMQLQIHKYIGVK